MGFADQFAGELSIQLNGTFVEDSPLMRARQAGIAMVIAAVIRSFGPDVRNSFDDCAQSLFRAASIDSDNQDLILAIGNLFVHKRPDLVAYINFALELAHGVLQKANRTLLRGGCHLAAYAVARCHRQILPIIPNIIECGCELLQNFGNSPDVRDTLILFSSLLNIQDESQEDADLLQDFASMLFPFRESLITSFSAIQSRLSPFDSEADSIFCSLLQLYQSMAVIYDHEACNRRSRAQDSWSFLDLLPHGLDKPCKCRVERSNRCEF
jgi:hypothetical protein